VVSSQKNGKYLDWQSAMKLYTDGNERMDKKFTDILSSLNVLIEHQVKSNSQVECLIKDTCSDRIKSEKVETRVTILEKEWIKITATAAIISTIITALFAIGLKLL
jgi:hypothetical protein